jgi:predicted dehydrogenase
MGKDSVGIGVIGCGKMGLGLVKKVLALDPRLEVRGLFDPDPEAIRTAITATSSGATIYPSVEALAASPDVDWVMIASWNCFHGEQTVTALNAGKHVFCQKPLATSFDDCKTMFETWKRSGRMFNIGFTLRYSPHYRKIKKLLKDGAVGRIVSMEFNETLEFNHGGYILADWRRLRKNAGTHLLEKCCHDIDLTNWMVGSLPSRVASFGGLNFFRPENAYHMERLGKNEKGWDAYSTWRADGAKNPFTSDKDIFDNQVAIIEYANGVRASFHANCNAGMPERRMYILGSEGAVRGDVLRGLIETRRIGFGTDVEDVSSEASGGHGGGDTVLAQELADSMINGVRPSVGLEEGLIAAVTCFAIDEAADTGKVVDVNPFWRDLGLG